MRMREEFVSRSFVTEQYAVSLLISIVPFHRHTRTKSCGYERARENVYKTRYVKHKSREYFYVIIRARLYFPFCLLEIDFLFARIAM